MANITLFFGSFNPIHIGHLILAQTVLNQTSTDEVWLVISPQNPFKSSSSLLNENQRLYLAELAVSGRSKIVTSNIEFSLPKPSYTVDTLAYLSEKYPSHKFSLLMGGDNIVNINKWKNYQYILNHYPIYVYNRRGSEMENSALYPNVRPLDAPQIDISSSYIRSLIASKKSIQFLVPDAVLIEIEKAGYYQ